MFIDGAFNSTIRAPVERTVFNDEYARAATFRSSGARRIFGSVRAINVSSLQDEEHAGPERRFGTGNVCALSASDSWSSII